jgi:hypothetical protein
MQYIAQIAAAINAAIKLGLQDSRFEGSDYNGIAILASDGKKLRPMIVDHYDNNKYITADDSVPLQIYHRTIKINRADQPGKSYGDHIAGKLETTNMALIAIGSRRMIKLTPEELEAAIVAYLPSMVNKETTRQLQISSCKISPTDSVLDPVTVYLDENKTTTYELSPNSLMIRINYTITSTYNTACFNICDC